MSTTPVKEIKVIVGQPHAKLLMGLLINSIDFSISDGMNENKLKEKLY
tara:strand:- start:385 stop:528 length:144 start_codon:yes stop_codon:yes gene_type:complete